MTTTTPATDEDLGLCSVKGCDRPVYAKGRCESHYRRVLRGSTSTAPARKRGTEALASLSLRLPRSVLDALGPTPAARAREVLTAWAKRRPPTAS